MEDVFALREESHAKLAEYEGRDELIEQARKNRVAAENELEAAAHALEKARKAVVPQFLAEVQKQMSRLEMGSAKLEAGSSSPFRATNGIHGVLTPVNLCMPQVKP